MQSEWLNSAASKLDSAIREQALARQLQLTKPPGALGELENLAVRLSAMQGKLAPEIDKVTIAVFAGDHGIASQGVSAFPQAVTTEMVKNFATGGAAISVLSREIGAELLVINMGTVFDPGTIDGVIDKRIAPGTGDFSTGNAMTEDQFYEALNTGRQIAERAAANGCDIFIAGEMGIGNTSSATAVACALLDCSAAELAGPGTGLSAEGIERKVKILQAALDYHKQHSGPIDILTRMGGFEIVAITGAYIACAKMGIPVLVDGFIATAAALAAAHICDNASDWFILSHASAEPGHKRMVESLGSKPLLDLGMRLGEGSGAATALPLLRLACALQNNMATFTQAGVSEKDA